MITTIAAEHNPLRHGPVAIVVVAVAVIAVAVWLVRWLRQRNDRNTQDGGQ